MTTNHSSDQHIFLRVAIVGALRLKVAKVLSLIANQPSVQDHDDEPEKRQIHIEYVPCVATFDSYENENGESVKYLVKLEQTTNTIGWTERNHYPARLGFCLFERGKESCCSCFPFGLVQAYLQPHHRG